MINRLLNRVVLFVSRWPKRVIVWVLAAVVILPSGGIIGAKIYQTWDDDPARGAVSLTAGAFDEGYTVPEYLDQGWERVAKPLVL